MKKLLSIFRRKTNHVDPQPRRSRCTFEGILLSNFETYKAMVFKHFEELGFACVNSQINYENAGCCGWMDFKETSEHMLKMAVANEQ